MSTGSVQCSCITEESWSLQNPTRTIMEAVFTLQCLHRGRVRVVRLPVNSHTTTMLVLGNPTTGAGLRCWPTNDNPNYNIGGLECCNDMILMMTFNVKVSLVS